MARGVIASIPLLLGAVDVAARAGALRRQLERRGCRASAIGVLVSLLFSVVPLLQVRFIKPSLLLRDETRAGRARDWLGIGVDRRRVAGAGRR